MIATLAKMLGLSRDDAEASMQSERAARAVLTRRNLFAAGAALAAGSAFSFARPEPAGFWMQNPKLEPITIRDVTLQIDQKMLFGLATFTYSLDGGRTHSAPQSAIGTVDIPGTGCTVTFPPDMKPSPMVMSYRFKQEKA